MVLVSPMYVLHCRLSGWLALQCDGGCHLPFASWPFGKWKPGVWAPKLICQCLGLSYEVNVARTAQHSTVNWCRLAGCQMYLYQLQQVFVNITNCICPCCKVYLSKMQNVFVLIAKCICAEHSRAQWCKQLMLVRSLADLFSRSCSFESIYSITAEQQSTIAP